MDPVYYTKFKGRNKTIRELTVEDLLFGNIDLSYSESSETVTIIADKDSLKNEFDITAFKNEIKKFIEKYGNTEISYKTYSIPKKTGGYREINDPSPETKECLTELQHIIDFFGQPCYHNSAYAYIKHRRTIDALKIHQDNGSNYYMKTDFKDFFGSINKESLMKQFMKIAPFCFMTDDDNFKRAIEKCFYHGKLPQGSPMSPILTNIMMIPFDMKMTKIADNLGLKYIRYCDDTIISGKTQFNRYIIVELMEQAIAELNLPFVLKKEKIRYGSRLGRNWNLGLMINGSNDITVGHLNKKVHKARLHHIIMAALEGKEICKKDMSYARGISAYYRTVEPEYFTYLNQWFEKKYHISMKDTLKY